MLSNLTRTKLFRGSASYFPLLDQILPRALKHRYSFLDDDWFRDQVDAGNLSLAEINHFIALDLLEKSHLAAVTALIRIMRWADALCHMHDAANYLGFAGALRGLVENGGDSVDGLLNVAGTLAERHRTLSRMLGGHFGTELVDCSAVEHALDHYIHAGWTGRKPQSNPAFTAKANVDYVRLVEKALPGAVSLYHRLCAIVHPSSASIEWLFEFDEEGDHRMTLAANDAAEIAALCEEFPDVANVTIQLTCNAALMTLRVLHKFPLHPQIPELKKLGWSQVKFAGEIEQQLRS
ncbi:hypothetical protein [Mesorhizobium sp.]|uniref:hypothetical protein n=1 Tax=Mesorhizobium sp. TaxID=1871066 RepID=UPI000FE8B8EF|nr:hypothetical protein [Mesorhizobium sp.]RWO24451.1 MAG: hypothetical protein EOS09_14880 [Mesorhizobium sp.]